MSDQIIVFKNRLNTITVDLGFDISSDTYTSQIRTEPKGDAPLIAEWAVSFVTDGTDGKLILALTELETAQITSDSGFMDFKRVVPPGLAVSVIDKPLEVVFRGSVTV
jgi:hypothetical protein